MNIGKKIKKLREEKKITQDELAKLIKSTKQTIFKYENGIITNIPFDKLMIIAQALGCTPSFLLGWTDNAEQKQITDLSKFDNIMPIKKQRIPLLGDIACGKPIFASEDRESYVDIGTEIKADFALKAHGDSMKNARIQNGDIVFIKKQEMVNNGEIAAVIIDGEATLKRVFYYPDSCKLILQAENPSFEPFVYVGEELNNIIILGKAIAFQSDVK